MSLHGVDVYLNTSEFPNLPQEVGSFSLIFVASRGTRMKPGATDIAWPQCRYFSEIEVTDQDIENLVAKINAAGFQWTKCQKLFKIDGVNAFSQPY